MNKTVNINLANTLFHIDDEAYNKLRLYLEAIKRSFAGTAGSDEIIADVEARVAELFLEKMENDRQVITQKEVDQVITIMGQPEDYMVDEDIFEDQPKSSKNASGKKTKKLYRDTDQKYIGGVCAGLEYYLGFDALWIRLIFLLFGIFSGFGFIAYIILWILVPEATSTSQKLDMSGKPINISNIERKVKEGFDDVSDAVKSVDYQKVGTKVKNGSKTFFDTIGDIIMFFFKVFGKFIGILLIVIGAGMLIGLFVALFSIGILDAVHFPGVDFYEIASASEAPVWLVSLFIFFLLAIPAFFTLYTGLKILVNNLKSIGSIAKFSLFGLWLISIGVLVYFGIRQAAEYANVGSVNEKSTITTLDLNDTIRIRMNENEFDYGADRVRFGNMALSYDENDKPILVSGDVRFNIKKSDDSIARIRIRKDSHGNTFENARAKAREIDYNYSVKENEIILNDFLTTATLNKTRDQEVHADIYIPVGSYIAFDESTRRHIGRGTKNDRDYYRADITNYTWLIAADGELKCQNCAENEDDNDEDLDTTNDSNKIIINEDGIDIDIKNDEDSFEMKIDENGVKIKSEENK